MSVIGQAFIRIRPDTGDFEPEARLRIGGALGAIAASAGALLAAGGIAQFFKSAVGEATEASKVLAQTNAVIKSTGGAAGITGQQISDLATSLSNLSGVDDEVIAQGENVLLTFTQVRNSVGQGNDVFNRATAAALDMSKALGTDLQGGIIQVGKALNDPIKGITALARVGVSFTEQQKEQIKTLVESGKSLDAQKIILKELETEFGGTAAAVATPLEKLKVAFSNLKEDVGAALVPAIAQVVPTLTGLISGLEPVLVGLGSAVGSAIVALGPTIAIAARSFAGLLGAVTPLIPVIGELVTAGFGELLGIVAGLAQSILGALVPAIRPLLAGFIAFAKVVNDALGKVLQDLVDSGVFDQLSASLVTIANALVPLLPLFAQLIIAALPLVPFLIQIVALVAQFIAALPPGVIEAIAGAFLLLNSEIVAVVAIAAGLVLAAQFIVDHWSAITGFFASLWAGVQAIFSAAVEVIQGIISNWFRIILAIATGGFSELVGLVVRHWDDIRDAIVGAVGAVINFVQALPGRLVAVFVALRDGVVAAVRGLVGFLAGVPAQIIGFFTALPAQMLDIGKKIIEGLVNGIKSVGHLVGEAVKGIAKSALDGVKGLFGIHSPSTVFHEIGVNTIRGMVLGLRAEGGSVGRELDKLLTLRPVDLSRLTPAGRAAATATTGPATGLQQNFHEGSIQINDAGDDPDVIAFRTATALGQAALR